MDQLDGNQIRRVLLEVVSEYEKIGPGYFQTGPVLRKAREELNISSEDGERVLLTAYQDLFRNGLLAWGHNLANPDPPFVHTTTNGRRALAQLSRDPYNPDGYLAVIRPFLEDSPVATSYIEEAVLAFQAGCLRATAVLTGAAVEVLVLELRDALVTELRERGEDAPAKLRAQKVKRVRDAISATLQSRRKELGHKLAERVTAFWLPVSDQIRIARNDAGHPTDLQPVTHDSVHAALLLLPEFVKVTADLRAWIRTLRSPAEPA